MLGGLQGNILEDQFTSCDSDCDKTLIDVHATSTYSEMKSLSLSTMYCTVWIGHDFIHYKSLGFKGNLIIIRKKTIPFLKSFVDI